VKAEVLIPLLLASACAHRSSEDRPKAPQVELQSGGWAPASDISGLIAPEERKFPVTSSSALDSSFFNHVEGDDLPFDVAVKVAPILAVTGTVTFDIPMSEDERVEQWIGFLTGRGRGWYEKWLGRSTRYVPLFWEILDQHGLPRDLVFLSMIESGFSPAAYSWAHAAGAWQFIPGTARDYGLHVGFWLDERRDFELATHAAARFLKRLNAYFDGDWYLAWAAYNAGVRKVDRAIQRTKSRDFWKLSRTYHLRRETSHYVPKLLAAAKIAKEPDKYGFGDVQYLPRLEWEVLTVTVATDLTTIATACGLPDISEIEALNPALRAEVTPPGRAYPLRVPNGRKTTCETGLASIPFTKRITYRYCEPKPKDTVASIAARFQTTPEAILGYNKIDEQQLLDFDELVIPVPLAKAADVPIVEPPINRFRPGRYRPDGLQLVMYEVRPGDSLWKVARRFRVSLKKLRLWNGLWKNSRLRSGQRLRVYLGYGRGPT
jgi:membrane-bound lytic murein transglycosylase D